MISDIREIMGDDMVQLAGDIRVRLADGLGLVIEQGDGGKDGQVIMMDARQIAHLHRLTTALVEWGSNMNATPGPEDHKDWNGL